MLNLLSQRPIVLLIITVSLSAFITEEVYSADLNTTLDKLEQALERTVQANAAVQAAQDKLDEPTPDEDGALLEIISANLNQSIANDLISEIINDPPLGLPPGIGIAIANILDSLVSILDDIKSDLDDLELECDNNRANCDSTALNAPLALLVQAEEEINEAITLIVPFIKVPAVSEWGLIAMTMLVLTSGTILLRRRNGTTTV